MTDIRNFAIEQRSAERSTPVKTVCSEVFPLQFRANENINPEIVPSQRQPFNYSISAQQSASLLRLEADKNTNSNLSFSSDGPQLSI